MVHNSLETFHSKDCVLSLELVVEYLGLPMNCVDSKHCALTKVLLSCNSVLLF